MDKEKPLEKKCCCSSPSDEIVQIGIGDDTIGLVALTQTFEQLRLLGRPADESVEDELFEMVAARNYIPTIAAKEYRLALVREYGKFIRQKENRSGLRGNSI